MGQALMGHTTPAETACRNSDLDMNPDESVFILIKHCRDMKQQETRLRFITLLLLLSCVTLFIFATLMQHKPSRQRSTAEEAANPAYSKQERLCPGDNHPVNSERLRIHLTSVDTGSTSDGKFLKWIKRMGESDENYNEEKRAIVIPQAGFYFVYLSISLNCNGANNSFEKFFMQLKKWNKGYNRTVNLTDALDGLDCAREGSRSLFVGQLFDLLEGDHVSVWIEEGYGLIKKSEFGAYLI